VRFFKHDREQQRGLFKKDESKIVFLNTMKNELKLSTLPHRMECFDNSNLQGSNPVAACVVFIDGKPVKSEYRHFHIKTVVGADDFASMEEIIYRRYYRRLYEGKELPDLIVIDGGKGQLHAALNSLERLNIHGKVAIIGLAKRMEEIYYPGDQEPYILGKNTVSLKTLMHIRDEAHRFGIAFHRKLREKRQVESVLNEIEGIGKATQIKLLQHFRSVENIKNASREDIVSLVGESKGNSVFRYFHEGLFQE
jgi:excinuclease ABC subunit C